MKKLGRKKRKKREIRKKKEKKTSGEGQSGIVEHRITRQQRNAPSVGYLEVNKNLRLEKLQKY